ncbi:MAG: hypothetical protein ABR974_14240 [Bacteroidales bacterium]|jgi:Ser-tRNA(Ala) deacylase AlaX
MAEKDYDPRMHTAEHILNSVMERRYGCGRSFRSHIERKKSKCDYHFKRALSPEEISEIENSVKGKLQRSENSLLPRQISAMKSSGSDSNY